MQRPFWLGLALVIMGTLAASLPLMQTIPNGADHYFMIDVGETQIVLNNWGTLHATGYPHYVMTGNVLTALMRNIGISPLVAAAAVSLVWGLLTGALLYTLAHHLTGRALLSAAVTLAYTLTRSLWIHYTIAEIYTFGLLILVGLLWLALQREPIGGWGNSPYARIYWLAILGGVGVAHHRAIAMSAPALLFAVWPLLTQSPKRLPRVLLNTLALGVVGFVPYLYLMIRARMGGAWVYGEPETWAGLWAQFEGTEAARFIGLPESVAAFWENVQRVNAVIALDVTVWGVALGLVGLLLALTEARHRKTALTLLISGGVAYGFHIIYYSDILTALILPVTLSLVLGWLLLADMLISHEKLQRVTLFGVWGLLISFGGWSVYQHAGFIHGLVTDTRGVEVIERVKAAPPNSAVMLPWGPQHFAVGYARDIADELPNITLLDHKADYAPYFEAGQLVVPEYVRHSYPLAWWEEQLGARVYPQAIAPNLVALLPTPERADSVPLYVDIIASQERITCEDERILLYVAWLSPALTPQDMSVFVHLLDDTGAVIAQDDRFAPVYGWRPLSIWQAGDIVHDVYTLPRMEHAAALRYGLYYQTENGEFVNEVEHELSLTCD